MRRGRRARRTLGAMLALAAVLLALAGPLLSAHPLHAQTGSRLELQPQLLLPGWNLVGWTGAASPAEATAPLAHGIRVIFAFDPTTQGFDRYVPGAPVQVNTLEALEPGQGLWVFVRERQVLFWERPALQAGPIVLAPGFNLVTWTGAPMEAATLMAQQPTLRAVYGWDAAEQRFRRYRRDVDARLNDLGPILPGQAVWIEAGTALTWQPEFPVAASSAADPVAEPATDDPAADAGDRSAPDQADENADAGFAQPTLTPDAEYRVIGPGCLNLRSVPTVDGNTPLACLQAGTAVDLTGVTTVGPAGRLWAEVQVNAMSGWVASQYLAKFEIGQIVDGAATYYHPTLAGDLMYCNSAPYNPADVTIAAATSWGCGTQLRVWRGDRFVDVVVHDTGFLPPNHVDLSEAAFQQIAGLAEGTIAVQIEVLGYIGS